MLLIRVELESNLPYRKQSNDQEILQKNFVMMPKMNQKCSFVILSPELELSYQIHNFLMLDLDISENISYCKMYTNVQILSEKGHYIKP